MVPYSTEFLAAIDVTQLAGIFFWASRNITSELLPFKENLFFVLVAAAKSRREIWGSLTHAVRILGVTNFFFHSFSLKAASESRKWESSAEIGK